MSYKTKLLLAISLISITLLAITTSSIILLSKDILFERTSTKTDTIGKILVEDIQRDLAEGIFNHIEGVITTADNQANIEFVSLVNRKNNIIMYSSKSELCNKPDPYKDTGDIGNIKGDIYIRSFPLEYAKYNFLSVQLGYSLAEMRKDLNQISNRAVYINAGVVIFILFIAWFISGKLLMPLVEMKNAADQIANGNFSPRLTVKTKDVIGELAASLNNMANQLDELTNNLNQKIQDATSELQQVNKELHNKTAALEDSNKKLKELDKLKSEFVSMVSHELRTPLTAIIGFSNTLSNLKLSDEQKEKYLKIIESEGKRLAGLIEDFLDISKIELGIISSKMTRLNIAELIKETIERIKIPCDIKIEMNFLPDSLYVFGDRDRIKQVILNITDNAIRYSKPGGKIFITAEKTMDEITVSIKDEGPGIKKEDLKKVFDKFFRSKDSIAQKSRGSGLGLAIVKGIIEMHNGKIWAESEPGKGAAFYFSLSSSEKA